MLHNNNNNNKEDDSLTVAEQQSIAKSLKNIRKFNISKINGGKQRYQFISQMIYFLENRSFDSVSCNLEMLPVLFKNDNNFRELVQDVYPILKLLVKLNSSKNVSDYSFKNILTQKLAHHSVNRMNSPKLGRFNQIDLNLMSTLQPPESPLMK